ncbi:MAG: ABC transporter substrate-binding protein [Corallococcus sp.]|nr:ABC transporter substrate-binding protein [Corallococcus sp.]
MKKTSRILALVIVMIIAMTCILTACEPQDCVHDFKDGKCTKCGEPDPNYQPPDLTTQKAAGVKAIETLLAQLKAANGYTDPQLQQLDSAAEAAKNAINAAEKESEVTAAVADGETALKAVEKDPLLTRKKTVVVELDAFVSELLADFDYTGDNLTTITTNVSNAKANFQSATTVEAINQELESCKTALKAVPAATGTHTYRNYSSMTPSLWNPHTYESNEESEYLDYLTIGLYDFVLNADKNGYDIVPEMASEMAVDVTSEYVGRYGVTADNAAKGGRVWKVKLNPNAKWENGEAITADSYIYSMQQLLSSENKNYRATAFTTGQGQLHNAAYFNKQDKAGEEDWQSIRDGNDSNKSYPADSALYIVWDENHPWIEGTTSQLLDALASNGGNYVALANAVKAFRTGDEAITRIDNNEDFQNAVAAAFEPYGASGWETVAFYNAGNIPTVTWDQVGFFKQTEGDDEYLVFALVDPVDDFYFYYAVVSFPFLVHETTYEANKKVTGGLVTSTYYTSVASTISYGPYKMTEFQADKRVVFKRNENWYGWTDGKHEGQYETTRIVIDIIPNQATALQMFLQGVYDGVSLTSADMSTYKTSSHALYTPSSNTWKLTFNSSKEALAKRESDGINKTLLSYNDFRKAISLSINKEEFVSANFPASQPAFGLINYMYVYDPDTGALYRDAEIAKKALVDYYGLEYGEGKEFDTLDEAYEAMTGYDPDEAKRLFTKAFTEALEAGDYKAGDVVTLEMLLYSNDTTYVNVYNFISGAITDVLKDTDYAGKVQIIMNGKGGNEFYDVMAAGETDIIMTAWGGGNFDPFGTIACYLDPDSYSLHEYGMDISQALTLTVPGESEARTLTLTQWCKALNGSLPMGEGQEPLSYTNADAEVKLFILASLEKAVLDLNADVTLWYVTGASMYSHKVEFATKDYIQLVGRGGLRFMTYNYDDVEWQAYVNEQLSKGDTLDYVS